jgi:hypothetical protein
MHPLFRDHKGAVDKTLREVQFAALVQVTSQRLQDPLIRPILHPALEPSVARLVWWVPIGQIGPLGARAQDPQHAIEYLAAAAPGSPPAIRSFWQPADERFQYGPLFVG